MNYNNVCILCSHLNRHYYNSRHACSHNSQLILYNLLCVYLHSIHPVKFQTCVTLKDHSVRKYSRKDKEGGTYCMVQNSHNYNMCHMEWVNVH